MSADSGSRGHGRVVKALHWVTLALLAVTYLLAWSIAWAETGAEAARLVMLHRSMGVAMALLTLVRLGWRQFAEMPPLPRDVPKFQRIAARANMVGLYVLLLLQPMLGLLASQAHGDHVVLFGLLNVPTLLQADRPLSRKIFALHGTVAMLLLVAILMHVCAALYHHFVRRDGVLTGMLPACRQVPPSTTRETRDMGAALDRGSIDDAGYCRTKL